MSLDDGSAGELPTTTSLHNVCFRSLKRTLDMFLSNYGSPIPEHEESQRKKLLVKISSEYKSVKDLPPPQKQKESKVEAKTEQEGETGKGVEQLLSEIDKEKLKKVQQNATSLIEYQKAADQSSNALATIKSTPAGNAGALVPRKPVQFAKPEWHAPWKLMRVISGHMGWVRCVAVDPTNEWFATGAADRTVKIWDLASGQLKLTLTGHINSVRGICISDRHPYLFSVGEDKLVKCWDLEYNKVVRHYHGHLSGVYSCAIHPTLDILITGGRDSVARVWDMRTKAQVHVLSGHNNTVMDIKTQPTDPQVITGSMDTTVKLWDITSGKAMCTLTNHKKAIRALQVHPKENTFVSGGADNIKKWKLPRGEFLQNLSGHNTIINCLALNQDGVLFSGGDNGTMDFWDYKSGHCFQQVMTQVQPGSLESEAGIYASTFDHSGSRLIVGEADKTIKIWKEDELATPESHPLNWKPNTSAKKY